MITRSLLVIIYILSCIRYRAKPWLYFQLNAEYFNRDKGIYSKLEMDCRIPEQWRLAQSLDCGQMPGKYPVFLKPEWGQNARGVYRVDNRAALEKFRAASVASRLPYLLQEAAPGCREFEIFFIPSSTSPENAAVLSITEVLNTQDDKLPVNGIYNPHTRYEDITDQFSETELTLIWQHMRQLGAFRIARVGLRTDTTAQLVSGCFHIFEVNLFLPMPLMLQSHNVSAREKFHFIRGTMGHLARITRAIPSRRHYPSIFFRKLSVSRPLKEPDRVNHHETYLNESRQEADIPVDQ
ncbi:MAG: hypothetical protein MJA28_01935 [Gammaproteobacteria bacterium]|nr:hypothetical protein [Gammaproteobacteria bacterium]